MAIVASPLPLAKRHLVLGRHVAVITHANRGFDRPFDHDGARFEFEFEAEAFGALAADPLRRSTEDAAPAPADLTVPLRWKCGNADRLEAAR